MPVPVIATPDIILADFAPLTAPLTAGDIIKSVRPQIPDPTLDPVTGLQELTINPDHDGPRYSATTLYLWLTEALKYVVGATDFLLEDWYAFASSANLPTYPLDQRWHSIQDAYAYQRQCYPMPEQYTIYPSQAESQPVLYGTHRRVGQLEVFYWPNPNLNDPITQLTADVSPTDDVIHVTTTVGFLPFGWIRMDGEMIQYNTVTNTTLSISRRGCSGTIPAVHYGTPAVTNVLSCSLWVKGNRTPTAVAQGSDPVEVPEAFILPIRYYLRSMAKGAEQDDAGEVNMKKLCDDEIAKILNNPVWQADTRDGTAQVRMYGCSVPGLLPLGPFGTVVG